MIIIGRITVPDFDKFSGSFITAFRAAIDSSKFDRIDVSSPFGLIMASREESEIAIIKKACQVTQEIYSKYLKEQIMDIIDKSFVYIMNQNIKFFNENLLDSKERGSIIIGIIGSIGIIGIIGII